MCVMDWPQFAVALLCEFPKSINLREKMTNNPVNKAYYKFMAKFVSCCVANVLLTIIAIPFSVVAKYQDETRTMFS